MPTQFVANRSVTEASLIRAGRRGNLQALDILFCRYQPALFHSVLGILGNQQDAEDALQDGLLSAFRKMKSFESRSQFSTWLTRVVINAALMHRRSQTVRPSASPAEPAGTNETSLAERLVSKGLNPEQLFLRSEIRAILRDQLEGLAPVLRTAFVLRSIREYSTSETAKMLDVSEQTLKGRLWRARRELAKRVHRTLLQGVDASPDSQFEP
jgi:RNA polymerase sigma-70 factor, ECF subfamily